MTFRSVFATAAAVGCWFLTPGCSGSSASVGGNNAPSTSGLPESTPVSSLSDGDLQTLCNWAAAYEGGAGTQLGCEVTVNPPSQCEAGIRASKDCPATVADVEACAHAVKADPCTAAGSQDCFPLVQCSLSH